jgi:ABC-type Fe3+ transport system permease subunit
MESTPWTVSAWRRQRQATWAAIRLWLIALLAGIIGFQIPFWLNREHVHKQELGSRTRFTLSTYDESESEFTLGLVSLVIAGVAGVAITFAVRRHYRCPKCNEIPMGTWTNVGDSSFGVKRALALFPAACPSCGAQLR